MQTLGEVLSTPDSFRDWLKSKVPDQIVGYQHLMCACPVAQFLREQGFRDIAVGNWFDLTTIKAGETTLCTPDWLMDFLSYIDETSEPAELAVKLYGENRADQMYEERNKLAFQLTAAVALTNLEHALREPTQE